jgi:4-amino-4-deoxy-L-arabinose transferase-like glycosyltransferase
VAWAKSPAALRIAFWAILLLTLGVRLINLRSPLLEKHEFRQTQTALTVWCYLQEGVSLLEMPLPIFGPPWQVPFEFPVYQLTAAGVAKATGFELDLACRLTNLLYFYLSAAVLYVLCARVFRSRSIAATVTLIYACSPFAIVWSRTCMIEYATVSFALGYLLCFYEWLGAPRRWWFVPLAIVCGSLGALSKITTMPVTVAPMLYWIVRQWRVAQRARPVAATGRTRAESWRRVGAVAAILAVLGVPVLIGGWWVRYSDAVKAASPWTVDFMSSHLHGWSFGTWAQRAELYNWVIIPARVGAFMLPGAVMLFALVALWAPRTPRHSDAGFLYAMVISSLLLPAVFFNPYLNHDYYLCAISPCLAILSGWGLHYIFGYVLRARTLAQMVLGAAVILSGLPSLTYLKVPFAIGYEHPTCRLGALVAEITPPDGVVAVVAADYSWSPPILYYAKRKGMMIRGDDENAVPRDFRFATLVLAAPQPHLLALYPHRRAVPAPEGYEVYVADGRQP